MLLDTYAGSVSRAATNPALRWPADFAERLELEWESVRRTGRTISADSNRYEAFEDQRRAFADAGRPVTNPYAVPDVWVPFDEFSQSAVPALPRRRPPGAAPATRAEAWQRWNEVAAELRAASPDGAERYFTAEEIERQADSRAADARRRAQQAEAAATGDFLPGLGSFLGQTGAMLTDPAQLATLPLGAPQSWLAGGLARRMLVMGASEAAINAAVQGAIQYGAVNPYAREAGFEPDPAEAVLAAGALGGAIGAAIPLFGAAAGRLFRRAGSDPERATAARIAEDAANIEGSTPRGASIDAHAATLARAEAAVAQGTLPVDLAQPSAWATRTATRLAEDAEFTVFTPAGRAVGVRYELAEADRLVASHGNDMSLNPAYPHAEGVQPRDRSTPMSAEQVQEIVARFQPERLALSREAGTGAPIVDAGGIVESGNGRVLALRRILTDPAYAEQRAAYLAMLQAEGFDPAGMQNPVLVARRTAPLSDAERRAFVREANMPAQAQMTAAETARVDAAAVADSIHLYAGGDLDLTANANFVARFLKSLPQTVRAGMLTTQGAISQDGLRRIRAAVLAHAYGDQLGRLLARFLEGDTRGLAGIVGALHDVAGAWSAMRAAVRKGEIDPAMDITADLVQAIETVDLARQKGLKVGDVIGQADITRPPLSPAGQAMLNAFFTAPDLARQASRQTIAARLAGYVDEAMKQTPGVDMFGARAAAPDAVLAATGRKVQVTAAEEAVPPIQRLPDGALDGDVLEMAENILLANPDRTGVKLSVLPFSEAEKAAFREAGLAPDDELSSATLMALRDERLRRFDEWAAARAAAAAAAKNAVGARWPPDIEAGLAAMAESQKRLAERLGITDPEQARKASTALLPEAERAQRKVVADEAVEAWQAREVGPVRQERRALIVLGPPASGKSTVIKPLAQANGMRLIDSDEWKKHLPEFDGGSGAHLVHTESARLADQRLDAAMAAGDNVALPRVGGNQDEIRLRIAALRAAGYHVTLLFNDLPAEKTLQRAFDRFRNEGRLVPPDYILDVVKSARATYDSLKGEADVHGLYSNDVPRGAAPRFVGGTADPLRELPRKPGGGGDDGGEVGDGAREGPPPRGGGSGGQGPAAPAGGGVAEPPAGGGAAGISPFAGRQAAIAEASRQIEEAIRLPDAARADLLEAQRVAAAAPGLAVPVGTGDAIGARGAAELLDMAEQGVQAAEAQAVCLLGAVVP